MISLNFFYKQVIFVEKTDFLHQINITKMISFCTHQKCFSLGYLLSGFHCKMDWNILSGDEISWG